MVLGWKKIGDTPRSRYDPPPRTDQTAGAILFSGKGKTILLLTQTTAELLLTKDTIFYIGEMDHSLKKVQPLGKIFERTIVSLENPAVMSPTLNELEGRLYLYFNIGARLKNKIVLAVAE
jgi:hypothetical protein